MSTKLSHLKTKAIALRIEGHSYSQIKKVLGLKSKGTISYWMKDVTLPKIAQKKLAKNILLATKKGLLSFNKARTRKIKKENSVSYNEGVKLIPKNLTKLDLLLVSTALYWGEGTKSGDNTPSPRFSFANSDPNMIKVCLRFLREILCVEDQKIRGGIHIYPDTNVENAKKFWAEITGLPKERFYIITQISRAGQNLRKNKLLHGTLHVKVNSRLIFYKVKGLINGLIRGLSV